jgi:type VI secretion system secreted protein Hcp
MAADAFLRIDGIPGESADARHKGELEVLAWSWGEAQPSSAGGSGGGAGKVQMQDFRFTAATSAASPLLLLACANGKHFKEAVLSCRRPGRTPFDFLKLTFTDVRVTAFHLGGVEGGQPHDETTLGYTRIQVEYRASATAAPVKAGWDLKTSQKV